MTQGNKCKFLISKFVKQGKISWPREMKIAKRVLAKYDFGDLEKVVLGFELNSLAFLLSREGEDVIKRELKRIPEEKVYKEPELTEEFYEAKYKVPNLKDFLKL